MIAAGLFGVDNPIPGLVAPAGATGAGPAAPARGAVGGDVPEWGPVPAADFLSLVAALAGAAEPAAQPSASVRDHLPAADPPPEFPVEPDQAGERSKLAGPLVPGVVVFADPAPRAMAAEITGTPIPAPVWGAVPELPPAASVPRPAGGVPAPAEAEPPETAEADGTARPPEGPAPGLAFALRLSRSRSAAEELPELRLRDAVSGRPPAPPPAAAPSAPNAPELPDDATPPPYAARAAKPDSTPWGVNPLVVNSLAVNSEEGGAFDAARPPVPAADPARAAGRISPPGRMSRPAAPAGPVEKAPAAGRISPPSRMSRPAAPAGPVEEAPAAGRISPPGRMSRPAGPAGQVEEAPATVVPGRRHPAVEGWEDRPEEAGGERVRSGRPAPQRAAPEADGARPAAAARTAAPGNPREIAPTPLAAPAGATPAPEARSSRPAVSAPPAPEPVPEPPAPARPTGEPARRVSLQVSGPEPERRVAVDLVDRGGKLHVAVRAPAGDLSTSLRQGLGDLVTRLERSGYGAEVWSPEAERASGAGSRTGEAVPAMSDARHNGRPPEAAPDSSPGEHERHPRRPEWVDEIKPRRPGRPEESFAWHLKSIG